MMLHEIILEEYSSDMGHGWKNRCEVAHTNLVQKYEKVKLREFLWPIAAAARVAAVAVAVARMARQRRRARRLP
jgi:hypothetical protein